MHRLKLITGVAFFYFTCMILTAHAADVAKIGIVDLQRVLETSTSGKAANSELKAKYKDMTANLKKQETDLKSMKEKLEREALVMSREQREEKDRELRIKANDLKVTKARFQREMKTMQKRILVRLQKDIMKLVEDMGKKEGFLLIMEKREAGIMYAPNTIDVTDKIIRQYDQQTAGQQ